MTSLGIENPVGPIEGPEIARISEALAELAAVDSDLAYLVEFKFFLLIHV